MFKSIAVAALFVAQVLAAISFTDAPLSVQAGQTYPLTWTSTGSGPVTILLKQGPSTALTTVDTIAVIPSGNSYSWTVPSKYANGAYAFEIVQGSDNNYWGPITYTGGTGSAASSTVSVPAISSAPPAASSSAIINGVSTMSITSTTSTRSTTSLMSMMSAMSTMSTMSTMNTMSTMSFMTRNLTGLYLNVTSTSSSGAGNATLSATTTRAVVWSNSAAAMSSSVAFMLCILAAMFYWQ